MFIFNADLQLLENLKSMSSYINQDGELHICSNSQQLEDKEIPQCQLTKHNQISQLPTTFHASQHLSQTNFNKFNLTKPLSQEISFEKDILRQHIHTFNKQVQNLKEFDQSLRQRESQIHSSSSLSQSQYKTFHCQTQQDSKLLKYICEKCQCNYFLSDIQNLNQLQTFLKQILKELKLSLAADLILISASFWTYFKNQNFKYVKASQISMKVNSWVQKNHSHYFFSQEICFFNINHQINFSKCSSDQVIEKFKTFLNRFLTTFLLITVGYFANPYYAQQQDFTDLDGIATSQISMDFLSNNQEYSDQDSCCRPTKKVKCDELE